MGRGLIDEQASQTVSDALRNVSGVNPTGGTGVFDFYTIRGFDTQNAATFLIDGVIEPESSYYSMYNAAGVEVLKGPAGFLYGNSSFHGAIGGAVNVVRKQPMPGKFGSVRGSVGSFDTYNAAVDWNLYDQDSFGFRVNAFYNESERFRDRQDIEQYGFNPSFAFDIGERTKVNVNLETVQSDTTPDSGIPLFFNSLPGVDRETSYQSGVDFSEQTIGRVQVDVQHQLNDNLRIRNKTYFRSLDWDTVGTLFGVVAPLAGPSADPADFFVQRTLNRLNDEQRLFGNQFEFIAEVETGAVQHRLLAGVEVLRFEDEFTIDLSFDETIPNQDGSFGNVGFDFVPLLGPVPVDRCLRRLHAVPGREQRDDRRRPYVIDEIRFSPEFALTVGARFDDIDFEDPDAFINANPGGGPQAPFIINTPVDRSDSDISPMAAITITPSDTITLYANFGQTFSPAGPRVTDDISPQRSTQGEAGFKARLADGRLLLSTAVYGNRVNNVPTAGVNGVTQVTADQFSQGAELELAVDLTSGWRAFASYAYNDNELTDFQEFVFTDSFGAPVNAVLDRSGNTAPFAPENLVSGWVSKSIDRHWTVGGGVRFVDERFIDEDNAFALDSYTRFDAMLVYNRPAWRFRLNLENVTDEEYEIRGFSTAVGSVIPAPGFVARGEVEFRF